MVCLQVLSQVVHGRHALPAVRAVVRVPPVVHHHHVLLHVAAPCEPHAARGAGVRPLPRVGQQVLGEVAFQREAPATLRTAEQGALSRVHALPVPG